MNNVTIDEHILRRCNRKKFIAKYLLSRKVENQMIPTSIMVQLTLYSNKTLEFFYTLYSSTNRSQYDFEI